MMVKNISRLHMNLKFTVTGSWWLCIQCYINLWKWTIIQSDKNRTMDFHQTARCDLWTDY